MIMFVRWLKALYLWPMAFVLTMFFAVVTLLQHLRVVVFRLPRDGRLEHDVAVKWGQALINIMPGWKITIDGKENLPPKDAVFVLVSNHESMADICAIYFLGIQFRWLSKSGVFKVPIVGWAMRIIGYIPIERGNKASHATAFAQTVETVKRGIPVCYFPEGTRAENGQIKPFRPGAFKLSVDCGVPILPMAIRGAAEMLPKGSFLPGKAHVQIRLLPMTRIKESETVETFMERVRADIIAAHRAFA
jgi:1-acyl-sn-glycerol-3-phosphate acyltransferase